MYFDAHILMPSRSRDIPGVIACTMCASHMSVDATPAENRSASDLVLDERVQYAIRTPWTADPLHSAHPDKITVQHCTPRPLLCLCFSSTSYLTYVI